MTTLNEGFHTGEFILSEADETYSYEQVVVTQTGTAMPSGTVISKLTATGKYVAYDDVGTDGSEVATGILYTPLAAFTGDVAAAAVVRHAEVKLSALTGYNANAKADLALIGIIVRA
jgi:hypothetical protein